MRINSCPRCGRQPQIIECVTSKRNGYLRRRMVECPSLCSVIPGRDHLCHFGFIYEGDGDDNTIFKAWNAAIDRFNENQSKSWMEHDYSPWTDDPHVRL